MLRPGIRAVTIGVDAITGISGLIWPGDHVDLILTQEIARPGSTDKSVVSETVLTDVRVIAVDQRAPCRELPPEAPSRPRER